jgi:hypothetical protein
MATGHRGPFGDFPYSCILFKCLYYTLHRKVNTPGNSFNPTPQSSNFQLYPPQSHSIIASSAIYNRQRHIFNSSSQLFEHVQCPHHMPLRELRPFSPRRDSQPVRASVSTHRLQHQKVLLSKLCRRNRVRRLRTPGTHISISHHNHYLLSSFHHHSPSLRDTHRTQLFLCARPGHLHRLHICLTMNALRRLWH